MKAPKNDRSSALRAELTSKLADIDAMYGRVAAVEKRLANASEKARNRAAKARSSETDTERKVALSCEVTAFDRGLGLHRSRGNW